MGPALGRCGPKLLPKLDDSLRTASPGELEGPNDWYQLLMTGRHLGTASSLVERVLHDDRLAESERVRLVVETESAMAAAEGVACRIDAGGPDESALADSLFVR
ncbi:hypothetical protein [Streptomyces typhae]|uniref:hypothetical protein n=1 Tax=Streptomyces typhae TaxID=2681492 RepID=UPI0018E04EE3